MVYAVMLLLFFFFFSSRRRHTRSLRDWSSDVCSSDLAVATRAIAFGMSVVAFDPIPADAEFEARHGIRRVGFEELLAGSEDRKSTRLNSSHVEISYAVFCLKKKISGSLFLPDCSPKRR